MSMAARGSVDRGDPMKKRGGGPPSVLDLYDADMPDTKNEVFQLFSKRHSASAKDLKMHGVKQPTSSASSSDIHDEQRPGSSAEVDHRRGMSRTPDRLDDSLRDDRSDGGSSRRRNSVFIKRGSLSMDPIKKVQLDEVYAVYKQLGTGRFGFIKLAEHKQSKSKIAIKFFPRPQTKQVDFIREYNYSYFLSPHPHIIDTYEGMYQTSDDSAFFFVQELCPQASLREAVERSQGGIGETATKQVMSSVLSAIEFMHNENLVHRNLKAENILVFDQKDFSKVKVADFGLTRKVDAAVKYLEYINVYHAPELCETVVNEVLTVNKSIDIWALGIIFYLCLKGKFPWQNATIMCKQYWEWEQWQKRKIPALPKKFICFSEKALKLLKKTLNTKPKDRWSVKDMRKCIGKEKLLKPIKIARRHTIGSSPDEEDETESSVYAYYPKERTVSDEERDRERGPQSKRSAIHQWISSTLNTMAEISEQVVSAREI